MWRKTSRQPLRCYLEVIGFGLNMNLLSITTRDMFLATAGCVLNDATKDIRNTTGSEPKWTCLPKTMAVELASRGRPARLLRSRQNLSGAAVCGDLGYCQIKLHVSDHWCGARMWCPTWCKWFASTGFFSSILRVLLNQHDLRLLDYY